MGICTAALDCTLHLFGWVSDAQTVVHVISRCEELPMLRFNRPVTLRLFAGETTAIQSDAPVRLRVACGLVWLTRAGDADDHFLGAGQTMALQPDVAVTVGAEQTASLRLEPVATPSLQGAWRAVRAAMAGATRLHRATL